MGIQAPSNGSTGTVQVASTNAPSSGLKGIVVTIAEVRAHSERLGWVSVSSTPLTVDLLSIQGRALALGELALPAGTVSQVRLLLAEGPQYVVLEDGTHAPLKTPSGQQAGLKLNGPFPIEACNAHTVTFDLDGEEAISIHPTEGGSKWILGPVLEVKLEDDQVTPCESDGGTGEADAGEDGASDAGSFTPTVTTLTIPAGSDIFAAGQSEAAPLGCADPVDSGGELLPPSIPVGGGGLVTLTAVSGALKCVPYVGWNAPDGPCFSNMATDLVSAGSISGIVDRSNNMFLVGVFTDGALPVGPPPPPLDFSSTGLGEDFGSLSPALNQQFFIGDGISSTGAIQQFFAPAGATRLHLGFADGYNFAGAPGCYGDNSGTLTATVRVE